MARDILRVETNERVDLNDFQFLADEGWTANIRHTGDQFLTDPLRSDRAFILDGFDISNPAGEQVQVDLGRAILGQREGGQIFQGVLTSEGDATRIVDVSTYANGTYYIYIRFEYVDGETSSRAFWNPQGTGSEFAQTIATRRLANWSMRIELASPGDEWFKIGQLTVSGGTITVGPTDQRDLYFEGPVNASYQSGWSSDGGGVANDRNSDRKQYGVKDLHTFVAAVKQCLEDIKGRSLRRWWERDIGGLNIGFDANPTEDTLRIGDSNFAFVWNAVTPQIFFDAGNDRMFYDRTAVTGDRYHFQVGGTDKLLLDTTLLSTPVDVNISSGGLAVGFSTDAATIQNDSIYVGDIEFALFKGTNPQIIFDWTTGNDYLQYVRSTNVWEWYIGAVKKQTLESTGVRILDGLCVGHDTAPIADIVSIGDVDFNLNASTISVPVLNFDATDNDKIVYNRSSDLFGFYINNTGRAFLDANGLQVPNGVVVGFSGTPSDDEIQIGSSVFKIRDYLSNSRIDFDTGDYIKYDRSANELEGVATNNLFLSVDANRSLRHSLRTAYSTSDELVNPTTATSFSTSVTLPSGHLRDGSKVHFYSWVEVSSYSTGANLQLRYRMNSKNLMTLSIPSPSSGDLFLVDLVISSDGSTAFDNIHVTGTYIDQSGTVTVYKSLSISNNCAVAQLIEIDAVYGSGDANDKVALYQFDVDWSF